MPGWGLWDCSQAQGRSARQLRVIHPQVSKCVALRLTCSRIVPASPGAQVKERWGVPREWGPAQRDASGSAKPRFKAPLLQACMRRALPCSGCCMQERYAGAHALAHVRRHGTMRWYPPPPLFPAMAQVVLHWTGDKPSPQICQHPEANPHITHVSCPAGWPPALHHMSRSVCAPSFHSAWQDTSAAVAIPSPGHGVSGGHPKRPGTQRGPTSATQVLGTFTTQGQAR